MKMIKSVQALIVGCGLLLFAACTNNNQSTKSAAVDSSSAPSAPNTNDTSMSNMTTKDTSMATTHKESMAKSTTSRKKGKATVGTFAERKTSAERTSSMKPDKSGVYDITEVSPAYPGGHTALEDYIASHIEYPQMAIDDNKEGTVNVQFIVNENGKVENAKVIGSKLGDGLDEEAERVISQMPNWTAGKVKGKSVKARITLPITYKIEE